MVWFWNFVWYSFCGFLLETAYARLTGGGGSRKCLRVLPLCPVYGAGALAILALPSWVQGRPCVSGDWGCGSGTMPVCPET